MRLAQDHTNGKALFLRWNLEVTFRGTWYLILIFV
jgi:hypothetical protein